MNKYPKAKAFLERTGMTLDEALEYFESEKIKQPTQN